MAFFSRLRAVIALPIVLALALACQPVPSADHSSAMDKIAFDLSALDEYVLALCAGIPSGSLELQYIFLWHLGVFHVRHYH